MRRAPILLAVPALLALPQVAHAGVGSTWAFRSGSTFSYVGGWGAPGFTFPFHDLPSLDVRMRAVDVQFHVLEFIGGIASESDMLLLGANAYFQGMERPAPGSFVGVFDPGVSLDLAAETDFSPTNVGVMGLARLGVEAEERFGCGLYVVPAVGIGLIEEEFELLVGGSLQVSIWVP